MTLSHDDSTINIILCIIIIIIIHHAAVRVDSAHATSDSAEHCGPCDDITLLVE